MMNKTISVAGLNDSNSDSNKDTERSAFTTMDEDNRDSASESSDRDLQDSTSHDDTSAHTSSDGDTRDGGNNVFGDNKDDRNISKCKCIFVTSLMVMAALLGTAVFLKSSSEETGDFQANFENDASQVIQASNSNLRKVFETVETLSKTTTSFMVTERAMDDVNTSYPLGFVTIPGAEVLYDAVRKDSGANVIAYVPSIKGEDFDLWAQYTAENDWWLQESWEIYNDAAFVEESENSLEGPSPIFNRIWTLKLLDEQGKEVFYGSDFCYKDDGVFYHVDTQVSLELPENGPASPIWTMSPPPRPGVDSRINYNILSTYIWRVLSNHVSMKKSSTFGDFCYLTQFFDPEAYDGTLETIINVPVFSSYSRDSEIVGNYLAVVPWSVYFTEQLPHGTPPIHAVVENSCGPVFTFEINGQEATLISSNEDVHDPSYDEVYMSGSLSWNAEGTCNFQVVVYPTQAYENVFTSNNPTVYMVVVLAIFLMTTLAFLAFDWLVVRRQTALVITAKKQNALVSSLFPKSIQKKLMEEIEDEQKMAMKWNKSGTAGLRSYLNDDAVNNEADNNVAGSKPIADLFPETTIMFADLAGFTAWSSTREPSQVFALLEAIYAAFDAIAKRRKVFKVEVVGDCYVAVAGLPDPRPGHAVVMAKFANECLSKMDEVIQRLERELGPDTAELKLRVGLHSGPVVAGVLRGDKSRFQLFGDTMNTASRMESNGIPGKIQTSQDTANYIVGAGKEKWLIQREEKITAKGKGELTTYFLNIGDRRSDEKSFGSLSRSDELGLDDDGVDALIRQEKHNRIAEWTVEVMASALKTLVATRKARKTAPASKATIQQLEADSYDSNQPAVITEVATCIILPEHVNNVDDVQPLDPVVIEELRSYVQTIASLYNDNPFHNFDHANHVVMSVNKLLSRITAPDLEVEGDGQKLHDHTYGITSDPLTWFACVFSALIHDVDHSGVPNAQLVKEKKPVVSLYNGKSVAEQNSFDIAWDLLMEPTYENLRSTIYTTTGEFKRFRQLVVNSVMATDIVDKDLKKIRNDRWDSVFKDTDDCDEGACGTRWQKMLKATIIIEHLIQASDVAHTMQHWHIYRRWNEKFFRECYQAYLDGRAETNPVDTWYKGEIGFFDFYIIPLAKKLKECGVFGVSSDEYLSYAMQNRQEWEERGEEMVREMVRSARRKDLAAAQKKTGHD